MLICSAPRPGFRSPFYDDDDSTEASLQHLMESFRQLEYDVTSDVPPSSRRRPSRRQQDDDFDLLLRTQARSDRSGSRSNTVSIYFFNLILILLTYFLTNINVSSCCQYILILLDKRYSSKKNRWR